MFVEPGVVHHVQGPSGRVEPWFIGADIGAEQVVIDATEEAGLEGGKWSTSAAFVDFDRDGKLDIFVGRYISNHLGLMDVGEIDPAAHIAHVGDLDHAPELLRWARERKVQGKAIVYPHRRNDAIETVPRWTAEDEHRYLAEG